MLFGQPRHPVKNERDAVRLGRPMAVLVLSDEERLRRVTVSGDTIRIELSNRALLDGTTGPGMIDTIEPGEPATIEVPFQLRRRGVEIRLVLRAEGAEAPDDKLAALVARSHRWLDQLTSGAIASIRGIAQAEGIDGGDVSSPLIKWLFPALTPR